MARNGRLVPYDYILMAFHVPWLLADRLFFEIFGKNRHFSANATALGLHPPSEAAGRVGNRAISEFDGEVWRGGSTVKQCGLPSPATLSRADPPQTAFREGEVGGVQREVSYSC